MDTKSSTRQIKLGAILSYVTLIITTVTGLVYTPWMVAKIGRANYGLYTLAISLINIFLLDFGLGSAVSRFLSKYRAEGDEEGANNIMGIIYKLYMILDVILIAVMVVIYFFLSSIYVKLTPEEMAQFRILYVMVACSYAVSFPFSPLNGILNAYEKFAQLKMCGLVTKVATVALAVVALNFSSSVTVVVAVNLLVEFAGLIAKLIIVKREIPLKSNFRASGKTLYKTLFSFTVWTMIISIMHRFTHSLSPSVLAITSSSIEIALYAPAAILDGYFYTLATAVNGLFLPRVSRYIAEKREDSILKLMIQLGRYQIGVLGLVFIGFICVGKEFMVAWMGPDYTKTYYCTLIILIPTLISSTQQIASTVTIAKKRIKPEAIFRIFSGVLGLGISYVASLSLGAIGICIGAGSAALLDCVFLNYVYKKQVGINMFEFYKKCYLPALPCYLIVAVLGIWLTSYIPLVGWIGIFTKACVVAVIFAAVMFFGYLNKEEKSRILSILKMGARR